LRACSSENPGRFPYCLKKETIRETDKEDPDLPGGAVDPVQELSKKSSKEVSRDFCMGFIKDFPNAFHEGAAKGIRQGIL
jgi:hypothetical protein